MGHNLRNVTNMLGLTGATDMLGLTHRPAQGAAPGFGMSSLLGQPANELPPVGQAPAAPAPAEAPQEDIQVTANPIPRMSPAGLGMPTMPNLRNMDPAQIEDMRQQMKAKEDMARQLFHKNSEFGTKGVLRDIVGNVSDFGRRLLGFTPRYNEEKWTEKAYGMTSEDPNVAAMAREQAMQYNPGRTEDYAKQLEAERASRISSAATEAYRGSQVAKNSADLLTGLGGGLVALAQKGGTPEQVQAQYTRMRPAMQKALDDTYGPGVYEAPEQFDPAFVATVTRSGYDGNTYQREVATNATNDMRERVAAGKNLTALEVAKLGYDARRYAADKIYAASVNRAIIQGQPVQTVVETTPTGNIVMPGSRKVTTVTRSAPGGAVAPPAKGKGQQRTVVRRGTANGRAVVMYSDGSVDYAD
jgi:hypothetical protein